MTRSGSGPVTFAGLENLTVNGTDNASGDATTLEAQYLRSLYDLGANVPGGHGAIGCIYNGDCKAGLAIKIRRAVKH